MKQVSRIPSIAFLLLGVLCILFPVHIAGVLPFLLGGIMLVAGVMHGGAYLRNQRFLEGESQGLGPDVVLVVMGVAFLCAGSEAIGLMGVVWGIIGLRKASGTIDQVLRRMYQHQPAVFLIVEAVIRIILALALLFAPFEKFVPHIVLLGLELILTNVKLPQEEHGK